jgi:hypothetical protein
LPCVQIQEISQNGQAFYASVKYSQPKPHILYHTHADFNENQNEMIWVTIDQIVGLVGAAQVPYRHGAVLLKALYITDKDGYSELGYIREETGFKIV